MMFDLKREGYEIIEDAALADVAVINTCGFIESAKQEAIDTILEYAELKKEGRIKAIVVTGCLGERYKDEVTSEIPEIDAVVGLGKNNSLAQIIRDVFSDQSSGCYFDNKENLPLEGGRIISTSPFAYLKIAEGCSNCCSYCAIPAIRGRFRSRRMEDIVAEAEWLSKVGIREIVVVAQDTTRYGEDIYGEGKLAELLRKLCKIEGLKWIRTLYCYPERITDELIKTINDEPKLVKYLDIPLQHCNDEIIKRMNRQSDKRSIIELIAKIRREIPGVTLRTTLIAGFPSETEEQFTELCEFVKEMRFERLGCFAYSQEEGTKAALLDGQLDEQIKERRAEIINDEAVRISDEQNALKIDSVCEVICEGFDRYAECFFGRSAADAPEIDGKIFFSADKKPAAGEFVTVKITDILDYDLLGERID